ncbi:MAG: hypothetical protein KBF98_16520 [Rhodoferax sp.]|nr:hypothetical protein [Rhodoferax sp.]
MHNKLTYHNTSTTRAASLAVCVFWFAFVGFGALESFDAVDAFLQSGLPGVFALGIIVFSIGSILGGAFFALCAIVLRDKARAYARENFTWPPPPLAIRLPSIGIGVPQFSPGVPVKPPRFSS